MEQGQVRDQSRQDANLPKESSQMNLETLIAPADQYNKLELLGKLLWLWMNSPLHDSWPIYLASRFLIPPIEQKQILLLERHGMPVAYCSWAFLTQKSEMEYMVDSSNIKIEDWSGGDRLWFIDWVAPFSAQDSLTMRKILNEKFNHSVARAIRVKNGKSTARVMRFKGQDVASDNFKKSIKKYNDEFYKNIIYLKIFIDQIKYINQY